MGESTDHNIEMDSDDVSLARKAQATYRAVTHRPVLALVIVCFSVLAALLEGVGVSFILPIIESARTTGSGRQGSMLLDTFKSVYDFFGVPFTLEFIILGVATVMVVRYTLSFLVDWMKVSVKVAYIRYLQRRAFDSALDAKVSYFDRQGSDEILNAIVTQARQAGNAIELVIEILQESLISLIYISISLLLAPYLTVASAIVLGVLIFGLRSFVESGYEVGDRVVDANERIQTAAQAGTQGIRDVKLFGLVGELRADFEDAVQQYTRSSIAVGRNRSAMQNAYQLIMAVTVFALIFFALEFTSLSIGELGIFLFANFRLGPRISSLNNKIYRLASKLPHLIRTKDFIGELQNSSEPGDGERDVPSNVETIEFDEVEFAYETGERVLEGVTFSVSRGEFVAFVGSSGAGKSTIASLLGRLYEPDAGHIHADGTPIDAFDIREWRRNVAIVRQNPFIFNESLRFNLTVGNRDASQAEIERICEIAQVTEFVDDLPEGYETQLGDEGVRLSGGQRQRVAIARALLKEDIDLLVLDEATSDLDTELEKRVHDAIEEMDRDYAMVVIAHRLSTVKNADRIYTLVDGSVAETGTHDELMAQGGVYSRLYANQSTVPQ